MLKFTPKDEVEDKGIIMSAAVLQTTDEEDNQPVYYAIYYAGMQELDGQTHIAVGTLNSTRLYPVEKAEDVKIDEAKGEITFSSYGRIYNIRGFQDSDGVWASSLATDLPAQALEERFMTEVENAFSPEAPADDENLYAAVDDETNAVKFLVYSSEPGLFIRDNGAWFKLPKDDESLDDLEVLEVDPKFIKIFDMAQASDEMMLADDVEKYKVEFRGALQASALTADADYGDACPPATIDIELNLKNRQYAIEKIGYGPLNPKEPSEEFWADKADRWSVTIEDAKKSTCGNCAVFNRTTKVLNCISDGLNEGAPTDEWSAAIDQAELGYCEMLDFKCAASRTCDAWVVGGPITDEAKEQA
jgi:hypothetical protein